MNPSDDVNRIDTEGNTPLHEASARGDEALVEQYLERGAKTRVYNSQNECARDVARVWGYDAIAARLDAQMKLEKSGEIIPYASLKEIREQNAFHTLAARGLFDQVIALAAKDPDGLTGQDLLGLGADGESVILKICQQGQLSLLLQPELWLKNVSGFRAVWEAVPKIYQQDTDVESFMSRLRQLKLQSRTARPSWKGPVL